VDYQGTCLIIKHFNLHLAPALVNQCGKKNLRRTSLGLCAFNAPITSVKYFGGQWLRVFINPPHKQTEGRAPVWALSLLQKTRNTGGGAEAAARLNLKLRDLVRGGAW